MLSKPVCDALKVKEIIVKSLTPRFFETQWLQCFS